MPHGYAPGSVGVSVETPFELRVSMGDMALEDAFRVILSPAMSRLTVGDLLNEVFTEEKARRDEWMGLLDVKLNPDLPAMYVDLTKTFRLWRRRDCFLRFFRNDGPEIGLFHSVTDHLASARLATGEAMGYPLLDVVIEQRYDALATLAERGGDKREVIEWLKGCTLLYFMDKHGFNPPASALDERDRRLLPVVDSLESKALIAPSKCFVSQIPARSHPPAHKGHIGGTSSKSSAREEAAPSGLSVGGAEDEAPARVWDIPKETPGGRVGKRPLETMRRGTKPPGHYEITPQGRRFVGQLIAETESCIDQFDVFSDVSHDLESGTLEFGTGRGADLRVQVYESEGMDPVRVVFLLRLYDASLDAYRDRWRDGIHDEEFFNEILRPAVDHDMAEEEALGWIIEGGYAHTEELAEEARRRASDYRALRGILDQ